MSNSVKVCKQICVREAAISGWYEFLQDLSCRSFWKKRSPILKTSSIFLLQYKWIQSIDNNIILDLNIFLDSIKLTLSPQSTTTVPYMQTAWIRMRCRVTQRLIWIQAVRHSNNIFINFEWYWWALKIEADKTFSRQQFIWRAKG